MSQTFNRLSRLMVLAALPAALLTTACGGNDDDSPPPTPVPDKGRVMLIHAAPSSTVAQKFLVNDAEVGQQDYGQNSGYIDVNAASTTLKVNNASSGATLTTLPVTVTKDAASTIVSYAPTTSTIAALQLTDDLTAPASGQAKIRLVHLGQGMASPLKLSSNSITGQADVPGISSSFATPASFGFVSVPAGEYSLRVTSGAASTPELYVGDGTGGATPANGGTSTPTTVNKRYEAGKIYTVVVRGSNSPLLPAAQQPRVIVIQNN
jgi:Domain of unknown function (DUF4397)